MWRGCASKPRVKRRRTTTLQSSVDGNDEVLRCVRELEAKEELFANYLYDDGNKGDLPEHVLEHINESLAEIFNCRLQFLQQRCIAIVAVHAFYRSDELYQKWTRCKFPLFTGLLICYILRQMRHVFEDLHEFGLVELYRQSHREFEDYVLEILEVSYRINEGLTRSTLKLTYPDVIKRKNSEKSACSVHYLLDLAMMAKCEKILNHSMCRRITNERWTPEICISRMHFIFAFFTFIPIFFIPFNRQVKRLTKGAIEEQAKRRASKKSQNANRQLALIGRPASRFSVCRRVFGRVKGAITGNWKNIRVFYSSPCSNFTVHTFFYFLYILLYTSVLLRRSRIDIRYENIFSEFWREILLYAWQLSYILDIIYSCLTVGFKKFLASNPADVTHNFFNIVWISLLLISSVLHEFKVLAWLWGILVVLSKLFFLISFIFSSIRIMRVFAADSFFGAIVVMMKKMVYTLWSFFIVFVLFWCTYAIAIVSLLEKTPTPQTLAWNIFSNGAFEIFGELKDEMKDGEIDECPKMFNSTDIRDFTIDCAFRTWMIPVLLFVYVLVSSVLLVNLVTSFFTNTFEQVQVSSMLHYRYKHYQRLVEFENKIFLPAPLSIFYHVPLMFPALLRSCIECIWSDEDDEITKEIDDKSSRPDGPESIELLPRNPENTQKRMVIIMDPDREPRIERVTSGGHSLPLIVDFIQESMKIFRANHEKEQVKATEKRSKPVVNQIKISSKATTGLYYGCWRRSRTGKMRKSFAKLKFTSRTVPVSIASVNLRSRKRVLSIML